MKEISFTIFHEEEKVLIKTHRMEFRDLRSLLQDRFFLDGFGECGGVGRCATCLIFVENHEVLKSLYRNEEATLQKVKAGPGFRLACQIMINEDLSNLTIRF